MLKLGSGYGPNLEKIEDKEKYLYGWRVWGILTSRVHTGAKVRRLWGASHYPSGWQQLQQPHLSVKPSRAKIYLRCKAARYNGKPTGILPISHIPLACMPANGVRQPPKKRAATESAEAASSSKQGARQSKLAKEHNITAQDEAEFREAFSLFAEARRGEKEGVMPVGDVRRAMM